MKKINLLTMVAVIALAAGEALALLFLLADWPWRNAPHRAFHLLQMALAIYISFSILSEARTRDTKDGGRTRSLPALLVLLGLVFSWVGDFVNSRLIDLTYILPQQTLLSVPFFTLAHVFYIIVYVRLFRAGPKGVSKSRVIYIKASLVLWPFLAAGLWKVLIPAGGPAAVKWTSLFYALVVTLMMIVSTWVSVSWKAKGFKVTLGGVLFWISDGIIGYYLLRPSTEYATIVIWVTYFAAQLLIMRSTLPLMVDGQPDSSNGCG